MSAKFLGFIFAVIVSSNAHQECKSRTWSHHFQPGLQPSGNYNFSAFANLTGDDLVQRIQEAGRKQSNSEISLKYLGITEIVSMTFVNFTKVQQIDLSFNAIENISEKSFEKNNALQKINLKQNLLKKIGKNIFAGIFKELTDLNLGVNRISEIEIGAFMYLTELQVIDLSGNCLKHIKDFIFKSNSRLKEIFLSENHLNRIAPEAFNSKVEIEVLELSDNKLEELPKLLVKRIKNYRVNDNDIKILDFNSELEKKSELESVYLSKNKISNITEISIDRYDITSLDLSNNEISDVFQLIHLKNLQKLLLQHNLIKALDIEEFHNDFNDLTYIDISNNEFHCEDIVYYRDILEENGAVLHSELLKNCNHTRDPYDYDHYVVTELRKDLGTIQEETKFIKLWCVITASLNILLILGYLAYRRFKINKPVANGGLLEEMEM